MSGEDAEQTPPRVEGVIDGKYEVLGPIGSGAMASVYKVRHTQLKSLYALKILDGAGARMQERLMREGRVQASLRHPNVVSVHDVLRVDGQPALLMEYVSGPSLSAYILANEPLAVDEIDRLARGILRGVRAAHAAGHLHRDLKPANILLQPLDGELVPKIADFGLVKILGDPDDPTQTRTGQLLGSPAYMSPEQTMSATLVDQRTDIWALGTVLYQLVTGRLAFPHRDLVTVFSMIRSGDFRDPRALRERIPQRMWNAILGAMTVDADRRIHDCDELLAVWSGEKEFAPVVDESVETMVDELGEPAPTTVEVPFDDADREARSATPTPPRPLSTDRPAPPADRGVPLTWAGLAGALVVILLAVLVGTQLRSEPGTPSTPPSPVPDIGAAVEAPAPRPAPPPEPAVPASPVPPDPAPVPAPIPEPPAPIPDPAPRTVASTPAASDSPAPRPAPEPDPVGTFAVTGDAERVWLVANGTHYDPGPVPPGDYSVSARFPGRPLEPVAGITVSVAPGASVVIHCRAGFRTCQAR
jgi:serine/threonine-protein kinase